MTKSKLLDTLIIILFYIGFSSIPFNLFGVSNVLVLIFSILAQLLIFFLIRLVLKKSPLKFKDRKHNKTNILLFIPVFLLCFSNYFTLFHPDIYFAFDFDFTIFLKIVLSLCVAFNEEYIFRMILIDNLDDSEKPIIKIIIAASIFAAAHLTHFFSTFNPIKLTIVGYTFFLGIILGMLYIYGGSFWYCVLFHFLYNVINGDFGESIKGGDNDLAYYLINISVGLVIAAYLLIIYFLKFHKKDKKKE